MPVRTMFDRPLRRDPILLVWALAVGFTGGVALQHHTTWSGSLEWTRVVGFLNEFCSGAVTSFLVLALLPACLRWLWRHGMPWNHRVVGRHRAGLAGGHAGVFTPGRSAPTGWGREGASSVGGLADPLAGRPEVRSGVPAEAQPGRAPQRSLGETLCQQCPARLGPVDPGMPAITTAVVEASGFDLLDQGRRLRAGGAHVPDPDWLYGPGECREKPGHTGARGDAAPAPPEDSQGNDRYGREVPAADPPGGQSRGAETRADARAADRRGGEALSADRRGGESRAADARGGALHPATAEVPPDGATVPVRALRPEVVVPAPRIDLPPLPVLDTPRPEVSLPRVDIDLPGARFTVRRTGGRSGDGRPGEAP